MGIRDARRVLMAEPAVNCVSDLADGFRTGHSRLGWFLSEEGTDYCEVGSVLLVPTYRLEEVEEVIESEKPGVPVEPYVGMVIPFEKGEGHYVVCGKVAGEWCLLTFFPCGSTEVDYISNLPAFLPYEWPTTPSTPAVTRKVKKWVKINQSEDGAYE